MHYKSLICSLVCLCFAAVIGTSIVENLAAVPKRNVATASALQEHPAHAIYPMMLLILASMVIVSWKYKTDETSAPEPIKCK
jgi:hypothetical protein